MSRGKTIPLQIARIGLDRTNDSTATEQPCSNQQVMIFSSNSSSKQKLSRPAR